MSLTKRENLKTSERSKSNDTSARKGSPDKIFVNDVPVELRETALKKSRDEMLKCRQYLISHHKSDNKKWPIAP